LAFISDVRIIGEVNRIKDIRLNARQHVLD
jgi:hypothetical protein